MYRATILANRTQLAMAIRHYKPFQFKEFSISQEHAAMKIGTDSILIGAWTPIKSNSRVLDIGTGTGLLSIMLAQKVNGNFIIDAIEIDKNAIKDAEKNFAKCPWSKSINLQHISLQDYNTDILYDVVISNPPFYQGEDSPDLSKNKARNIHATLNFKTLLEKSSKLLKEEGYLYLIIPMDASKTIETEANIYGLHVSRKINVRPTPTKDYIRVMIEFQKTKTTINTQVAELCIQTIDRNYSDTFKTLTHNYYLNS